MKGLSHEEVASLLGVGCLDKEPFSGHHFLATHIFGMLISELVASALSTSRQSLISHNKQHQEAQQKLLVTSFHALPSCLEGVSWAFACVSVPSGFGMGNISLNACV